MSKELTKEQFVERILNRKKYLFSVGVISTPNDNYVEYAYNYIMNNEINNNELKNIYMITRSDSYKHNHSTNHNENSNREEEHIVFDFFENKKKDSIKETFGELIDYQVPMKDTNKDTGIKAIDFINLKDNILYLSEIKAPNSKESILKAILEIQTYYQIINKDRLLKDFGLNENTQIKKSVIIFTGTKAEKQLDNMYINKLISLFDINVILLDRVRWGY